MFKCVYKADMTEQQINKINIQKKAIDRQIDRTIVPKKLNIVRKQDYRLLEFNSNNIIDKYLLN